MKRLILVVLCCAGCSGQVPPTEYYLLRSDAQNRFSSNISTIVLGNVTVANYLDRRGLVTESADGTIVPARYNRWAEPLRESLREFLANEIAQQANTTVRPRSYPETDNRSAGRRIDIRIDQLHGTASGDVVLVAYWALVDPQGRSVISEHEYVNRESLSADGYGAMVEAEKRLLQDLAAKIAASLN